MGAILTVNELTKTFHLSRKQRTIEKTNRKTIVAVDHLSFSANEGEIFGLLGPNGAGKTTTLRMLATLIRPDSGDAFVEGVSIVNDPNQVRKKLGFLTSEMKLEGYFTPNYLFDFFASLHQMDEETTQKRKKELFSKFGINKYAEVKISDLSTGMKQKISLVISIIHDPQIIIFDEPTNGLDIVAAKNVTDFILELKNQGKTILLSTHIFSLVHDLCDRVGIIINGKMVLEGSYKELTKEEPLEDLFFREYYRLGGEKA